MFAKYPQEEWTQQPSELEFLYKKSACTRAIKLSEMLPLLENEIHGPYIKKLFFEHPIIVTPVDSADFIKATIEGVIPSVRWALVARILEEPQELIHTGVISWLLERPEYLRNLQRVHSLIGRGRGYKRLIEYGLDVRNFPSTAWSGETLIEALKRGMPLIRKLGWFSGRVEQNEEVLDFVIKNNLLTLEYMYHYMEKFGSRKTLLCFMKLFFEDRLAVDLIRHIWSFV